jgi:peptide/nickel transport system permease protein
MPTTVRYLLVRLASAIFTLWLASLLIFCVIRLAPGDPALLILGRSNDLALGKQHDQQAHVQALRQDLGLDQPLALQYAIWFGRMLRFDFGSSLHSRRAIQQELAERLPATLVLSGAALLLQIAIALPLGLIATRTAGRWPDLLIRFGSVVLSSTPAFVLGIGLLLLFAVYLPWYSIRAEARLDRLWLPAICLGVLAAPRFVQVLRANLLQEQGKLYVLFARARGIPEARLIWSHLLPNVLLSAITVLGGSLTSLLGGAVVIESIFAWPGIGKYALDSILLLDYPVIQGYAMVIIVLVISTNLLIDSLYLWLDPRLRIGSEQQHAA